jgi:hypothetical protein
MKNVLNVVDKEKSTFFNPVYSGQVTVELNPEWAMSVLEGDDTYFELENQNKDIKPKYGFKRSSNVGAEILNINDFITELLKNPHQIVEQENKNFKTVYAVFENGKKWMLNSTIIGMIPKRASDHFGSKDRNDGNIWTGDSKND